MTLSSMNSPKLFSAFVIILSTINFSAHGQVYKWQITNSNTEASFRALSVVNDSIAWVAGTKGWIGRTVNGGRSWTFLQVHGFENYDFRSLYAHDEKNALIANAGTPANILLTNDGGQSWSTVYTLRDSAAFIDGVDFWNRQEGMIFGDPLNGKMFLLRTNDSGITWTPVSEASMPELNKGEASFAASGTTIRCVGKASVLIATGGLTSRIWRSDDKGNTWKDLSVPMLQGKSTTGIFSVAVSGKNNMIIAGGDYLQDSLRVKHIFYSIDSGRKWLSPEVPTRGYRECVEYIDSNTVVATGPTGTEISFDGGKVWRPESDEKNFHVVRKARTGKLIVIAGGKGMVGILKLK